MVKKSKLPSVAIIGLPNVGKSTLFNRLIGVSAAIVSPRSGTTRDLVRGVVNWRSQSFELIDTAGLDKSQGEIEEAAKERIFATIKSVDLLIFLVDGTITPSQQERQLAVSVHKSQTPVILAINKADKQKQLLPATNFNSFGIKSVVPVAAISGLGCEELLDQICSLLPTRQHVPSQEPIRVTILGRPNVGKTSLLNKLSGSSDAIVSDIAGTTRDVNYGTINYKSIAIEFADTAGLRRRGKIGRGIEYFSSVRTKKAIARADICLILLDAADPLVAQDMHIAGLVKDAGKGLILVVNKWDAVEDKDSHAMSSLARQISAKYQFISWSPLIFVSAHSGQNIEKLKELTLEVNQRRSTKLPTVKLNKILTETVAKQAPAGVKNIRPKLNYITQTDINPPTFTIFSSHPSAVHFSYLRYLENSLRASENYVGTPIILELRSKHKQ